jgi:hypothetical protein
MWEISNPGLHIGVRVFTIIYKDYPIYIFSKRMPAAFIPQVTTTVPDFNFN